MARVCQLTGKRTTTGNNRPFSMKATKRTFRANIFSKKVFNPLTGKVERMKLSAKAIRTLKKWAKDAGVCVMTGKPVTEEAKVKKGVASKAGEGKHVHKVKLTPKQKKEEAAKKEAELLGKKLNTEDSAS